MFAPPVFEIPLSSHFLGDVFPCPCCIYKDSWLSDSKLLSGIQTEQNSIHFIYLIYFYLTTDWKNKHSSIIITIIIDIVTYLIR